MLFSVRAYSHMILNQPYWDQSMPTVQFAGHCAIQILATKVKLYKSITNYVQSWQANIADKVTSRQLNLMN